MIAFLDGIVAEINESTVVIDVHGVGYEAVASARTRTGLRLGAQTRMPTAVVVREESWTIYGFADADERSTFAALQAVKGVGPRLALTILGTLTPEELRSAVATANTQALTTVPGIGRKSAERLVLDLRDRIGAPRSLSQSPGGAGRPSGGGSWRETVAAALTGLGWQPAQASAAVDRLAADLDQSGSEPAPIPELLRNALQYLNTEHRQGALR